MGGIGTPFIYISNVLWENRAPTSLSLAGTTLVLFNVSFHKLLSSKQPIFLGKAECKNSWVYIPITLGTHNVAQGNVKGKR